MSSPRSVSVVGFDEFELLDAFGPIELLSRLPDECAETLIGPTPGSVRSHQVTRIVADRSFSETKTPDIVGPDAAAEAAASIEYEPRTRSDDDPFTRANGLD